MTLINYPNIKNGFSKGNPDCQKQSGLVLLSFNNMKGGIYDLVADGYGGLSCRHKSHADVFDNVLGGEGKVAHFLRVDLLGLGHNRDISIVDSGVKQSKETEGKSGADLGVLIDSIDEVDLVMCRNNLIAGELCRHIDCRVYEAVVALGRNALDDNHILVLLQNLLVGGGYVLMLNWEREADLTALDCGRTNKRNCALHRLGKEESLASGVDNETCAHLKTKAGESLGKLGDVLNDLGILKALGKGERAVGAIYDKSVGNSGKRGNLCTVVGRCGNVDSSGFLCVGIS